MKTAAWWPTWRTSSTTAGCRLYCVDSVDSESFYNNWAHPGGRIYRHVQYEEYMLNEVLPLSQTKNPNPFLMTHGCSFGAYHAVNIAFRHPHLFGRVLALSGKYDMSGFFSGYYDDNHLLQHAQPLCAQPQRPQHA